MKEIDYPGNQTERIKKVKKSNSPPLLLTIRSSGGDMRDIPYAVRRNRMSVCCYFAVIR